MSHEFGVATIIATLHDVYITTVGIPGKEDISEKAKEKLLKYLDKL
jgi:hypothetical protein